MAICKKPRFIPGFFLPGLTNAELITLQLYIAAEAFNPDFRSATISGVFQATARTMFCMVYRAKISGDIATETLRSKKTGLTGR